MPNRAQGQGVNAMNFLLNVWYVAAWSEEVGNAMLLPRTIIDTPVILWRDPDGGVSALLDRCPHRLVPLSLGHCDGATLQCAYHGLRFGSDGRCIENPHGPVVAALHVPKYPVVERHGILWIWMGEAAVADPASIPDLSFIDNASEHSISHGYMHAAAAHTLFEDNILDLSHADYLHPSTLGGGSITRSKAHIEERGDTIFVQWLAKNEKALPIMRPEMPDPDMLTDMWTEVLWHPSGVMRLEVGATPAGQSRGEGICTFNAHIMTPETATSTHYFYCNQRNYKMDDPEYNAAFARGLRSAFEGEDKPIIEAQQRRTGDADLFDLKPTLLAIDSASTRARRTYRRLVAAQAGVS